MKPIKLSDRELRIRGFMVLAQTFGDVEAERFIALMNREPMDYTRWREQNMYIGESVHDVAERARASAARYHAAHDIEQVKI